MTLKSLSDLPWLTFALLLTVGVGARLLGLPANFSPTAALVLFAGFYFRQPLLAVMLAILTLTLSDLVLGGYEAGMMAAVYIGMALPVLVGRWLRRNISLLRLGGAAIGCSLAFFLISNLGVWAFSTWYPASLSGLVACYVAALPFYQHTLTGDLIWVTLVFGGWYLAQPQARQFLIAR